MRTSLRSGKAYAGAGRPTLCFGRWVLKAVEQQVQNFPREAECQNVGVQRTHMAREVTGHALSPPI